MGERAELTDAERRVYEVLVKHVRGGGRVPSRAQLAAELGFASDRAVSYHVENLEEKGYLRREGGDIELVDDPRGLPVIGVVAAGAPITPGDEHGRFNFHEQFPDSGDLAFMRVRGRSMVDAHIADGDMVIIRRDPDPPTGAKVVCSIDGEVTLKKLSRIGKQIVLRAYNRDEGAKDRVLREDENTFIVGVLVGVVRKC